MAFRPNMASVAHFIRRPTTALRSSRPTITSTWPSRWPWCRSPCYRPWPWSCATIRRPGGTTKGGKKPGKKAAGKGLGPTSWKNIIWVSLKNLGGADICWHQSLLKESWWKSLAINRPLSLSLSRRSVSETWPFWWLRSLARLLSARSRRDHPNSKPQQKSQILWICWWCWYFPNGKSTT